MIARKQNYIRSPVGLLAMAYALTIRWQRANGGPRSSEMSTQHIRLQGARLDVQQRHSGTGLVHRSWRKIGGDRAKENSPSVWLEDDTDAEGPVLHIPLPGTADGVLHVQVRCVRECALWFGSACALWVVSVAAGAMASAHALCGGGPCDGRHRAAAPDGGATAAVSLATMFRQV